MKRIFVYGQREKMENYAAALEACGAAGVFSLTLSPARDCHALLLPGGGDMDPARYDQPPAGSDAPDPARDQAELELVSRFLDWGRPVLGICRGLQVLNVALGGDLIQELPTAAAHRHLPETGDQVHPVTAEPGSFLERLYGREFAVNSAHHQALGRLAPGLSLCARCAGDGVAEAAAWPQRGIFGVQFHPERMAFALRREDTVDGAAIFRFFLDQCR